MTESRPLPHNTVHSRFLDYTAERQKQRQRALFKQNMVVITEHRVCLSSTRSVDELAKKMKLKIASKGNTLLNTHTCLVTKYIVLLT